VPENRIKLEVAAFLDSSQAKALDAKAAESARAIAERFLVCAYDEVGKAPHLLDGQEMHEIVGHLLPGKFARKDPAAPHALAVLRAFLDFLGEHAVVTQSFEIRSALESTAGEFEEAVRTGTAAHHAHGPRQKPFVHVADKVGRNDPCPCGSGKKFKKCCATLGE
jgi:preprotein translocase subunit SecA